MLQRTLLRQCARVHHTGNIHAIRSTESICISLNTIAPSAASSSSSSSSLLSHSHCRLSSSSRASFHTSRSILASKPNDLDDLFGEEETPAKSTTPKKPSTSTTPAAGSRLSATLATTRVTTQASAAAHAAAASLQSQHSSLSESEQLLDPTNPPKLEPKHLKLLRVAVADLERKLERAVTSERLANPHVETPTNPNIEHLGKRLAVCRNLVAALFPPEIVGIPFDENATGDLLDYAESMPGVLNVMTPDHVDPMKLMAVDHKTTRQNRHVFCLFCKPSSAHLEKNQLVYTNLNLLTQFVNERGMIIQRSESRLCMKHQRKLARTIKQARQIGLLSPSSNWRVDQEFVYGQAAKDFNPHQVSGPASTTLQAGMTHAFTMKDLQRSTTTGLSEAAPTNLRGTSERFDSEYDFTQEKR